ncbi:hypothetical protein C0993_010896 [Termitomyces sp. T159_Od127]|nr:hypothetical protein C0993_010896 [Termitomyces sp. T159_Od127]
MIKGGTDIAVQMYGEGVIKQQRRGPNGTLGTHTEQYVTLSPTRSSLGRRKQREIDIFSQTDEQDPKTPTRPRKRPFTAQDAQMEVETETETGTRTTTEAEAIVVYQLENLRRDLKQFSDHHAWSTRARETVHEIAKKLLPELIEAGERQNMVGNADSARALQETAELRLTIKDLAKAVNTLVAYRETVPTTTRTNQGGTLEGTGTKTVIATGTIYKPTKTDKPNARLTTPNQCSSPHTPKDQYHPARLIVIPRGEKFDTNALNPRRLVNLINDHLARSNNAKHLCVASARYNFNQNLIIMMHKDQKGEEL